MACLALRPSRRRAALLGVFLAALIGVLAVGSAAQAQTPDRSGEVTPAAPFTWQGDVASGLNETFDPTICSKELATYCDITLVNVVPGDFYSTSGGGVEFSTDGPAGQDIDLLVFESGPSGALGAFVGASAGFTADERVSIERAEGYYLLVAFYFAVDNAGYDGKAEFFRRNLFPADIDDPPGIQDVLASDPGLGYRSHSEPHIAQSPTKPELLVAGSKEYNRDRDSLPEYDFKIGTQVSFDRGESWTDLGQLNVCPREQAPPESYPLGNTCYPEDDPNLGGTEPEDATDPRGQGDTGEDYITSDPWVDFDDEGNAYAMVLDSPGGLVNGNGWGMSFHRWKTPSKRDIRRGRTWSNRIPINAYETPEEQASTLDDKNTFAVNNAGPDGDGRTGIIVACWGQNYDLVASSRQRIVCERSTDGGRSWPDEPTVLSPPPAPRDPFGPFVIGVHVVADTQDPNTFYAVWLDTLTGALDSSGLAPYWFTRSTDGGQTWEPARIIQRINPIPQIFPRQSFRNLSLPIVAVGPNSELHLTYADYNPAPNPGDEDGLQADIKITSSLDGGASWSAPTRVNQDGTNADQFQQYIRATESGQLNVFFFDRRLDVPEPPNHPGNYFIDNFLARSNDGGATWTETRLTHDTWDPSINPPISGSGEFIGDYQGLVADGCFAISYANDTHLANDPGRDPDFDAGLPRSQFQEVFAWRLPNTSEFGGTRSRDCGRGDDDDDNGGGDNGNGSDDDDRGRPAAAIAIVGRQLRVQRGGYVAVGLRCPAGASRACAGKLSLRGGKRVGRLGATRFRIRSGTSAHAIVRLSRSGFRLIRKRGSVRLLAAVVPANRRMVARGSRAIVTPVWRSAVASRLSSAQRRTALDAMVITEKGALERKRSR
jgi:hypothetical protein